MQIFQNLAVWQRAHSFTLHVYDVTKAFPREETFGLSALLRRSSATTSMKIAEACGQDVTAEFLSRLAHARAITTDVEYQLLLAHDLHFINPAAYDSLRDEVIEVRKMLSGLMKSASV